MRLAIDALLDYALTQPSDLLFALEAAQLPDQRLVEDNLTIMGVGPLTNVTGEEGIGRRTWARGSGRVTAHYTALFDVHRPTVALVGLREDDRPTLPALVTPYLWPSRYCEADLFEPFVRRTFGELTGGNLVHAMVAWLRDHLAYVPGVSAGATTARDTFVQRQGVCRDYSHLLITLARAAGLPARMVGAYAWRLEPQDFHAVVEIWLDGAWQLIDPTGLVTCDGIVRIGVGRDATDISFLTIFGEAQLLDQQVRVARVE